MHDYNTILAPLDEKLGHVVTVNDWHALAEKSDADFTDDDLTIVRAFAGPEAWRAKREARDRWHAPAPVSTPVLETKAAAPALTAAEVNEHVHSYIMDLFVPVLKEALAERDDRIVALEQENAALKATAFLKDAGLWRHGATYALGDVAQFSGSAWVCTKAHVASGPSADHTCWRLWIKRGRDGKDAR